MKIHECSWRNCGKIPCGAKQFNDVVVRLYFCKDHILKVAQLKEWPEYLAILKK